MASGDTFVKFGRPQIGKVARCLPDFRVALPSARIAPKICHAQLQTIYSECPKFHSNPFTSGGVIAGRMNIVEMRHKVFPILGEATASSASNDIKNKAKNASVVSEEWKMQNMYNVFYL